MFLLIAHFDVDPPESAAQALTEAAAPVRLLAAQPDTRRLRWGRSTEEPGRLVLVAEFDTAAAYRRAQSPLEVRAVLIPWLSRAEVRTSGAFEVLAAADGAQFWEPEVTVPEPGR
jgi:Antibiotic biosynthesis monooxygenase